jgi:ABC-type Zn uptake system ZnuABC Zn-binding protein ZnuA
MRWFLIFPAILGLLLVSGCGSGDDTSSAVHGVRVVATTTQIGALTRAIAGSDIELTVLLEAGADAHDYEPNPQAVKKVRQADVVLKNGIGLDDWLDKTLQGAGGSTKVVVVTAGVKVLKAESGDEAGHDDPHVWHDPENAKVMVDNIVTALSAADQPHAATFQANGTAYKAKLDQADAEVRGLIDSIPPANRKMVTNHDAFGYFMKRYGLTYVGAIFPVSSKEGDTSAKDLADLSDLIKRENVKAVFAEEEVDAKIARELANDTGVKIVEGLYADSLGGKGSGADTVDGMLVSNAKKIAEALR